ncbi:10135_t:CDS:2 [Paraglomus occultum]|uniref:10135_t:CDS:1 n=1 Tax=Paraglomus occultum TaxID=144539 RepID=A0A9N9GD62_9GLOM|nr:10135_t:CDS:2 [Paraglomus occultum]
MSLVADYQSDSSENEDSPSPPPPDTSSKSQSSSLLNLLPPPKHSSKETISSKLQPSKSNAYTTPSQASSKGKRDGPVKIFVDLPKISEGNESEEERETKRVKVGGGLLDLLPAPKKVASTGAVKANTYYKQHHLSTDQYASDDHSAYDEPGVYGEPGAYGEPGVYDERSSNAYGTYYYDHSISNEREEGQEQTETKIDNDVLQQLGGRRGRAGPIQIKEISAADQLADAWKSQVADISKPATSTGSYSHLKPTKGQKRKHNIMYLAYQSKSMENDLKEQFATNRKTKRETQAKYGIVYPV